MRTRGYECMKTIAIFCLGIIGFTVLPKVHAIVLLPAVVLIPIIKIVAMVIGGLSLPAVGMSALWSRVFGKPLTQTIAWMLVVLLVLGVLLFFWLRFYLPTHPII